MILFNTFFNFNFLNLIVVIFSKFRSYERSELQVHQNFKISTAGSGTRRILKNSK